MPLLFCPSPSHDSRAMTRSAWPHAWRPDFSGAARVKRQEYQTTSMVAQLVKNMPAMWETWVQSLDWKITWRREWPPTPIFWPGEFHGLYIPWGCKELDTTEQLSLSLSSRKSQRSERLHCGSEDLALE